MVAATDSFVLYLNGKPIGTQNQAMGNMAGIHDITSHLHSGKNVIGVRRFDDVSQVRRKR